jgi:hypothetical protein
VGVGLVTCGCVGGWSANRQFADWRHGQPTHIVGVVLWCLVTAMVFDCAACTHCVTAACVVCLDCITMASLCTDTNCEFAWLDGCKSVFSLEDASSTVSHC